MADLEFGTPTFNSNYAVVPEHINFYTRSIFLFSRQALVEKTPIFLMQFLGPFPFVTQGTVPPAPNGPECKQII